MGYFHGFYGFVRVTVQVEHMRESYIWAVIVGMGFFEGSHKGLINTVSWAYRGLNKQTYVPQSDFLAEELSHAL